MTLLSVRSPAAWNGRRPGSEGGTPTEKEGGQDRHPADGPVRPAREVSEALDASHHEKKVLSDDPAAFPSKNEHHNDVEFFPRCTR